VTLIEAVARCIGHGSPKREACRKLLLSFIKQRSANALALGVWCNEKLIQNVLFRDCCKKSGDMTVNHSNIQAPAIFDAQ